MGKMIIYILSLYSFISVKAQFVEKITIDASQIKSALVNGSTLPIELENKATSIAFEVKNPAFFKSSFAIIEDDTISILPDCINDKSNNQFSRLIILEKAVNKFNLHVGDYNGHIIVHGINSGQIINTGPGKIKSGKSAPCEIPEMISQSVWREGLTPPSYSREINDVHNLIVHHSATSNSLTNYTNVVRNIYVYHTESRGWSDIGYNYLVAPDGSIFMGRDPGTFEQDEVKGAHFCGSNSGTMGICMMGTYTNVEPTFEALVSLKQLLSWKTLKGGLNPVGNYPHALNANLKVVAGHRDGCATECPGQMTYNLLPGIRLGVEEMNDACKPGEQPEYSGINIYPGIFHDNFDISSEFLIRKIEIFNISGIKMAQFNHVISHDVNVKVPDLVPGVYIITLTTEEQVFTEKIICSK